MWMKDNNSQNALASLPYEATPKPRLPVTEGSIGRNDTARLLVDSTLKRRRFIVRSPYGRVEHMRDELLLLAGVSRLWTKKPLMLNDDFCVI